ncbi:MAG: hypothetical protein U9N46_05915 [Euryarchaeota archaeon]|nr:hypothetical protein [Euryarchaeota archaeon]
MRYGCCGLGIRLLPAAHPHEQIKTPRQQQPNPGGRIYQSISEKILSRASGTDARAGDFVIAWIDCAMAHDGTSVLAIRAFEEMGAGEV